MSCKCRLLLGEEHSEEVEGRTTDAVESTSNLQLILKSSQVNSLQIIWDPEADFGWFCT